MLKKLVLACAVLCGALSVAHAAAVVSDVSYTTNSITFTQTGDLSGYATPGSTSTEFGIAYYGNLWAGNPMQGNHFSGHLLQGDNLVNGNGNTGDWYSPPYTWFDDNGFVFSGSSLTISWTDPMLNANGTGSIAFFWGGGFQSEKGFTVLNSVQVVNGVVQNQGTVPEPASMALVGAALLGVGAIRRRSRR